MTSAKSKAKEAQSEPVATNYEESIVELEKLIADMESGKLTLEATMAAYKRGAELLKQCQQVLEQVEQQVKVFSAS